MAYTNPLPARRRPHEGAVPITCTTRARAALTAGEAVTALSGGPVTGAERTAVAPDGWHRSPPGSHTTAATASAASNTVPRARASKRKRDRTRWPAGGSGRHDTSSITR
ncbi:hypothetical protein [Actinoallomurus sp. CA-142502]|uniref:hypothetical protein n=1 Tax=Actinoallomurus sp. CA-142502 TaxID=3239885 RepID=UPI003D945F50